MSKIKNTTEPWNGKTYSEIEEFIKGELDRRAEKADNPNAGNIAVLDEKGNPTDSGHSPSDYLTEQQMKTVNGQSLIGSGDIVIPRGRDAVNPFKGWFDDVETLRTIHPQPASGDYAYVKGAEASDPTDIYVEADGEWEDSGRDVDSSNTQTFQTSQAVNEVKIVNDLSAGGKDNVLSAEQGKVVGDRLAAVEGKINGVTEYDLTDLLDDSLNTDTNSDDVAVLANTSSGKSTAIWISSQTNEPCWVSINYREWKIVRVPVGSTIAFKKNSENNGRIAVLTSRTEKTSGSTVDFCDMSVNGFSFNQLFKVDDEEFVEAFGNTEFTLPTQEGRNWLYLYITTRNSGTNGAEMDTEYYLKGEGSTTKGIEQKVEELTEKVEELEELGDKVDAIGDIDSITGRLSAVESKFTRTETARRNVFNWDGEEWSTDFVIRDLNGKQYTSETSGFGRVIKDADGDHEKPYWGSKSGSQKWILVSVERGQTLHYDTHGENLWIAVLKAKPTISATADIPFSDSTGFGGRINLNERDGGSGTITMPDDATGLYVVIHNSAADAVVSGELYAVEDVVTQGIDSVCERLDESQKDTYFGSGTEHAGLLRSLVEMGCLSHGGNSLTEPQETLIRKAKEFSLIQWRAKEDIPYLGDSSNVVYGETGGAFARGNTITGIPYSSVKETDKFVGTNVSIHTFMTAANNPFSLLYTENVSEDNSNSAWGLAYHGTNCATYYGTVCSEFTSYCAGWPVAYATAMHDWLYKRALKAVRLYNQTEDNLKVGDILVSHRKTTLKAYHTRIVINIERDGNGHFFAMTIAHSTGSHVRTQRVTRMGLDNAVVIAYRPMELYKGSDYEDSAAEFIDADQLSKLVYDGSGSADIAELEAAQLPYEYNNEICTFAGDKACFAEGDLIVLNYNLSDDNTFNDRFSGIEVYKDGILVHTYSLDDLPAIPSGVTGTRNALYLGTGLEPGSYKAKLSGSQLDDPYTYWEVVDTSHVTLDLDDTTDMCAVEFPSTNGAPVAVCLCESNGHGLAARELTEDEIANGRLYSNFRRLSEMQLPGEYDESKQYYLKLYIKGRYGVARAVLEYL